MPAFNGHIAIVGVAESDYGRVPYMTEMQLHAQALQRVLVDSGLRKEEIDGVFCSSHTLAMPTVMLCEYLQLFPRYSAFTTRRPGILQERRGRCICTGRPYRIGRPIARQYRWRGFIFQSSRYAWHLPHH